MITAFCQKSCWAALAILGCFRVSGAVHSAQKKSEVSLCCQGNQANLLVLCYAEQHWKIKVVVIIMAVKSHRRNQMAKLGTWIVTFRWRSVWYHPPEASSMFFSCCKIIAKTLQLYLWLFYSSGSPTVGPGPTSQVMTQFLVCCQTDKAN